MKRLTLVSLGALVLLGVINNVAAALFANTFGIGLLDLNGGTSLIQSSPPDGFPAPGPAQVAAILAAYPPNAAAAHVAFTLTLDILLPAAVVTFGWAASRTLTVVFHRPRPIAAVGIIFSIGYGLGELMENAVELALLSGNGTPLLMTALPGLHIFKSVIAGLLLVFLAVGYLTAPAGRTLNRLHSPSSRPTPPRPWKATETSQNGRHTALPARPATFGGSDQTLGRQG
jgi:hypothetical protein